MRKFILSLLLSCLFCQNVDSMGLIATHSVHPVSATFLPMKNLCCLKEGRSTAINILYLFEFGDAGIDTAANQGCITHIHYVNKSETSFLILFRKLTTIVYGD